ncbi:MAG: DUF3500 domain-containing protein [Chthoniobacteraceae bacterium]
MLILGIHAKEKPASKPEPARVTASSQIAEVATRFLATLNDDQRAEAVYAFKDDSQRKRWSNFPMMIFSRGGLRLGDLSSAQRTAALAVLQAALSEPGYAKVSKIMEGDEVLKETDKGGGPGGPGGPAQFGRDNYFISFLGQPSATAPWTIQFGGHHLGLNLTLVGDQGTLAPSHTGAQPAIYELEGKTVRPLGREVDKAYALIHSLSDEQRKQAVLGSEIRDLVLGPGRDGQMIQPEGIKGSELTGKQRALLLDLAGEWTGIQNETFAKAKMDEMKKNAAETWFAWSGSLEKGAAAYFRIQGPTVFIEYSPQTLGGDTTRHTHTIYRDPVNDYGAKWLKS